MKKSVGILGMAPMVGALATQSGMRITDDTSFEISGRGDTNPIQSKRSSKSRWRTSKPSEHFGERSKIITAKTKNGELKQMKLKNALKKGLEVC